MNREVYDDENPAQVYFWPKSNRDEERLEMLSNYYDYLFILDGNLYFVHDTHHFRPFLEIVDVHHLKNLLQLVSTITSEMIKFSSGNIGYKRAVGLLGNHNKRKRRSIYDNLERRDSLINYNKNYAKVERKKDEDYEPLVVTRPPPVKSTTQRSDALFTFDHVEYDINCKPKCQSDGQYIPDVRDCRKFYQCANLFPHEKSCGLGTMFDLESLHCKHSSGGDRGYNPFCEDPRDWDYACNGTYVPASDL